MSLYSSNNKRNKLKPTPPISSVDLTQPDSDSDYNPTNSFTRRVAQPLMLALLVACLLGSGLLILQAVWVGMSFVWLIPLTFLVALASIYTTMWLHHPNRFHVHRFAYRAAEAVVLVLLMRLLTWGMEGNWPQWSLLARYYGEPWLLFQDASFIVGTAVVLLAWERGMSLGYIFHYLAVDAAEIAFYRQQGGRALDYDRPLPVHRSELVARFTNVWLGGGVLVIVAVAIVALDLSGTAVSQFSSLTSFGLPPIMVWLVCLYFLTGFALLSQGRLATLNARWLIDGADKTTAVDRNWTRYATLLVVFVGLLAALMPLGSTSLMGFVVDSLIQLFYWIFVLFVTLFFGLLALLLGRSDEAGTTEEFVPPPPSPVFAPEQAATNPFLTFLFGAAFWTVLIIVAVSAVMFFLRDRGITLNSAGLKLLWAQVKQALHTWWLAVRRQTDQMQEAVRGRLNQANVDVRRDGKEGGWRFVRLNALSPRDKLRYFFLSTERRAAEKGVSRQPAETPREYAEAIKETWSPTAVSADVDPVTEAFLRAQYSPHDIDPADVEDAKAHWEALRRQLRHAPGEAPSVPDSEADS